MVINATIYASFLLFVQNLQAKKAAIFWNWGGTGDRFYCLASDGISGINLSDSSQTTIPSTFTTDFPSAVELDSPWNFS
jgi:hypothetical protein